MLLSCNKLNLNPANHTAGNKKLALPSGKRLLSLMISQVLALGAVPHIAHAVTIGVDGNTQEVTISNPNGINNGNCTLGEAILAANSDAAVDNCPAGSGADTIELQSSMTYTLTNAFNNSNGGNGLPSIRSEIVVNGNNSIIERDVVAPDFRILSVSSAGNLTLNKATIRNGSTSGLVNGGGIYNSGTLTINDSAISENTAYGDAGGIINSGSGTLMITNSTLSDNHSTNFSAGALKNEGGIVTILNSTFSGNTASYNGGAIRNRSGGTMTITNSTFSGNGAWETIENHSTLHLQNTIIANSISGKDCDNRGTIATNTKNLIEDGSCGAEFSGDPNLGSLTDNGGPTKTHALLPGSFAIDAGDNNVCPATDQRGVTRPINGICDIGAYEEGAYVELPTLNVQSTLGGQIKLIAKPESGYKFLGFECPEGSPPGGKKETWVTGNGSMDCVAIFYLDGAETTLTVSVIGSGTVVDKKFKEIACPSDCEGTYQIGSQVTLIAKPAKKLTQWTGDCEPVMNKPTKARVIMNEEKSCTAHFE